MSKALNHYPKFMKLTFFVISASLFLNSPAQKAEKSFFKELKEKITDNSYPKIDAIIVEHNDKIILEEYFNGFKKDTPHDVRSSFKSITNLLAGIAVDKKLIALLARHANVVV